MHEGQTSGILDGLLDGIQVKVMQFNKVYFHIDHISQRGKYLMHILGHNSKKKEHPQSTVIMLNYKPTKFTLTQYSHVNCPCQPNYFLHIRNLL